MEKPRAAAKPLNELVRSDPAPVDATDRAAWLAAADKAEAVRRPDLVAEALRRAAALGPPDPHLMFRMGSALANAGQPSVAEAAYRKAAELMPERPDIRINVGAMLERRHGYAAAAGEYGLAAGGRLNRSLALSNLAGVLTKQGRVEDALAVYREALSGCDAGSPVWSNYLYTLNYSDRLAGREIVQRHLAWGREAAARVAPLTDPGDRDRGKRRLKIAYMSPDFVRHSVAFFTLPALAGHDRRRVEVVCYQTAPGVDEMTGRLQAAADGWADVSGLDDARLAARIAADGVDVLIDLAGHTAKGRPGVLARRPAPLQAGYIGYPNITGLPTVDLRFTDERADPRLGRDPADRERLARLPRPFIAYAPPEDAPPPARPTRRPDDGVVFASFNNLAKATPRCLDLWAETLKAAPKSRLLLKARSFADAETRDRLTDAFARRGVAADRLDLRPHTAAAGDHLGLYSEADIALDSMPYNGATTTMEALWMGTPVLTLAGRRHCGRVGASLLGGLGLNRLVAADAAGFVEAAARLAADPDSRRRLSGDLRDLVASGPLTDGAAMARALEHAIFAAWKAVDVDN